MQSLEADGGAGAIEAPAATGSDREPHPWRRYAARVIDLTLLGLIGMAPIFILLLVLAPDAGDWLVGGSWIASLFVLGPLSWFVAAPINAFFLTRWRATPGKWLFGLRVSGAEGGRLRFRQALTRELHLLFWGAGLGLPLIGLLCMVRSYFDLENDNRTRWDAAAGSLVEARGIAGWQLAGVIVGTVLVAAIKMMDMVDRLMGFGPPA